MAHCIRHYEEPIAALCRSCNGAFCSRCLVFAFGPKKPPYCVGCALTHSGVRVGRTVVQMKAPDAEEAVIPQDKRVIRAQKRAEKAAAKPAAARSGGFLRRGKEEPVVEPPVETPPRPSYVPAPSGLKASGARPV